MRIRYAVIADIVGSRDLPDRDRAQQIFLDVLARAGGREDDRFDAELLLEAITHLPRGDRWETLARSSLRSDLYETLADLTLAVTEEIGGAAGSAGGDGGPAEDGAASSGADEVSGPEEAERAVAAWEERHPVHTARVERLMEEVRAQLEHSPDAPRLSTLSVAVRALRDLV